MSAHRYWKVVFPVNPNVSSIVALCSLDFRDSGGANLATGGTSFSSSHYDPSFVDSNAFDGNTATAWASSPTSFPQTEFLGYDFGAAVDVHDAALTNRTDTAAQSPQAITLMASDDNVSWHLMAPTVLRGQIDLAASATNIVVVNEDVLVQGGLSDSKPVRPVDDFYPTFPPVCTLAGTIPAGKNFQGGAGSIRGHDFVKGTPNTPVGRPVYLYERSSGVLVDSTRSDPLTGAYGFDGLDVNRLYMVATIDTERNYNAVIADGISPVIL